MKLMTRMTAPLALVLTLVLPALAHAQETAADVINPHAGLMSLAIAIGIGIAALGGAFGQSRAAAAALEGIARNPNASDKVFVPMILGLAFIESLVLFTWVLMFLLLQKI
jgi:F-type H+-transporting ATPase subunit c